ncbi:hypothetical protein [Massilia aerilata]|uniref:Uncharacterized protein n=1 Tax=Massilia aerilata TaxID=453817 RepID=A0ABW0S7H3_9BURK
MPLTPPPSKPQRGDRKTFAKMVDAFIAWLINFVTELNAFIASLNSLAAGGAYAIPYTFDSSSVMADPGAGKLRLGNPAQNASVYAAINLTSASGAAVSGLLNGFGDSTSAVKGSLRLTKVGDTSKWLVFDITNVSAVNGYKLLTLTPRDSSSASPFANGDAVILHFQRTGDKGAAGDLIAPTIYVREEYASGANAPAYTNGQIRALNTVAINTIPGASLSGGVLTLPAGTYDFDGNAWSGASNHRVYVRNITDSTPIAVGTTESINGRSSVRGFRLTWATGNKQFSLVQACVGTGSSGGIALNNGQNELYSELAFRKVA